MSEKERTPTIACTLSEKQERKRSGQVLSVLVSTYDGTKEREDGYTLLFNGTDEALSAVAAFVANELRCCSFAKYTIDVSPPYEETRLTVTGPDGTKEVFGGLVEKLESEAS
jgi:hypothetical protein